jgi:hypothetical protein
MKSCKLNDNSVSGVYKHVHHVSLVAGIFILIIMIAYLESLHVDSQNKVFGIECTSLVFSIYDP